MSSDNATERILNQLLKGNVGLAIAEMEVYLAAWPQVQTSERLRDIKEQYELLAGYWRQGMDDPQQQEQYHKLLQRFYVLYSNVIIHRLIQASSFLKGLYSRVRQKERDWSVAAIRREMENFVSEVAMLELEPAHQRGMMERELYKKHQEQMNDLFNYVLTSRMWTDGVGRDFTEMLLSPTVDSVDQQFIVSAVTLSLLNQFDMVKFRLLTDVYRQSRDELVRQRALVGWVFALDDDGASIYPEERVIVQTLLKSERVCKELTELQIQLVYTMNAENDTTTMQKEIMPDLLRNNSFQVTRNGIVEREEDPLEDILHPDAAEQRMERLEASFQRMVDMQRQGADIYFGGFSQMKRFPFFYDIGNWMVPFYMQHPDIAEFVQKLKGVRFMEQMLEQGPFCNSDKYSLVIAFQEVLNRLPESMRQLMERGEASMDDIGVEHQSPAYIRRVYLMDLYRLFRLFPNRSAFHSPFDTKSKGIADCFFFCSPLFCGTPLDACKPDVVRVLRKHQYTNVVRCLLDTFPESMRDVQYYLWAGNYNAALQQDPDNERALVQRARHSFDLGMYEEAAEDYERLLLLHPGKVSYMLNRAVCLVNMEEYEDALKLLYQLNYEHADDVNVLRVLAWTLTCDSRLEQATCLFGQLLDGGTAVAEDYKNYGYCLWLQGSIDAAADNFRKYLEEREDDDGAPSIFDYDWLTERGISKTQIKLMEALVVGTNVHLLGSDDLPF